MNTNKKKDKRIILLLIVAVILMTVGFAGFAQQLTINGTVNVTASKWSVHYVTSSYEEASGSVAASSKTITDTDYEFTTTLTKPGDVYEATVNVTNDGTFDANLVKITMSTLTPAQQKYLTYTVTYAGTDYTATTGSLTLPLDAGATEALKVKVVYVQPADSSDLPSEDVEVEVTGSLDYEQAE